MLRLAVLSLLLSGLPALSPAAEKGTHVLGDMVEHSTHNPHIALSPTRASAPGDAKKAKDIALALRAGIEKYRDVRAAEADGYRRFGPRNVREVHYYHIGRSLAERRRLDPTRPSNLLYAPGPNGSMRLIGAMFTAPAVASSAELNARVPLSQTRWHKHTNICVPRNRRAWLRRGPGGLPLFGPKGSIATQAECRAEGGRFHQSLFGWMVHVYPFRADPAEWWAQHHR